MSDLNKKPEGVFKREEPKEVVARPSAPAKATAKQYANGEWQITDENGNSKVIGDAEYKATYGGGAAKAQEAPAAK